MRRLLGLSAMGLFVAVIGCYHATINTGLTPSSQTIEKSFASGWIYGLIPPSTVETQMQCPHGAAKVETQLSFVNMLVGFLTLDIYTPMNIKVTCAAAGKTGLLPTGPTIDVGVNATPEQLRDAIARAAIISARLGEPVFIR